jgi:hypothetical protein
MKWTKTEDVRIGKMWYIVDRTLTTTSEIDKDDLVISPFQLRAHCQSARKVDPGLECADVVTVDDIARSWLPTNT